MSEDIGVYQFSDEKIKLLKAQLKDMTNLYDACSTDLENIEEMLKKKKKGDREIVTLKRRRKKLKESEIETLYNAMVLVAEINKAKQLKELYEEE